MREKQKCRMSGKEDDICHKVHYTGHSACFSEGTVRNYISTILDKLSLRDRTQLAVFYWTKVR